jgi:small-conductance mechanosensitive channel
MATAWHELKTLLKDVWAWSAQIEIPLGKSTLNLAELVSVVFAAVITLLFALWLAKLIERRLAKVDGIEANTRVVLARFIRAALLLIAFIVALVIGGVDLTLLGLIFGSLGVGLGFGLQKIAASYVGGFIVLLDKGIKLGDMITVDKYYGQVTHINARYTVIRTFDSTESIIPNDLIVSTPIVNHSYSNRHVRVKLPISVAYDTDIALFTEILVSTAAAHARVLREPVPDARLTSFEADGIAFELCFWIADPENGQGNVRSDIAIDVWAQMKVNGIITPYPQRVIHLLKQAP